jgi:hypothetical protein
MNPDKAAMKRFKALVAEMPLKPTQEQYEPVRAAYHALVAITDELQMAEIWELVKAKDPAVAAFATFATARTYRYHQSPNYKADQKKYMAEYVKKPEVKLRQAEARKKYRAKMKREAQASRGAQ